MNEENPEHIDAPNYLPSSMVTSHVSLTVTTDALREDASYRISREYPVTHTHVRGLLDFFSGDEQRTRSLLDAFCGAGFIPTADGLRELIRLAGESE